MIYEFRYRSGIRGVLTAHLDAEDLVSATAKAQKFCATQPGALYIVNSVQPWLITVPDEAQPATVEAGVIHKPSEAEQKANLARAAAERKAGTGVGSTPQASGRVGA